MEDAKLGRCWDKGGKWKMCVAKLRPNSSAPNSAAPGQGTGYDNGLIRYHFRVSDTILPKIDVCIRLIWYSHS